MTTARQRQPCSKASELSWRRLWPELEPLTSHSRMPRIQSEISVGHTDMLCNGASFPWQIHAIRTK